MALLEFAAHSPVILLSILLPQFQYHSWRAIANIPWYYWRFLNAFVIEIMLQAKQTQVMSQQHAYTLAFPNSIAIAGAGKATPAKRAHPAKTLLWFRQRGKHGWQWMWLVIMILTNEHSQHRGQIGTFGDLYFES